MTRLQREMNMAAKIGRLQAALEDLVDCAAAVHEQSDASDRALHSWKELHASISRARRALDEQEKAS